MEDHAMKLSEAIRLGAMATEQARNVLIITRQNGSIATCAFGSALYAVGRRVAWDNPNYSLVLRWPWIESTRMPCPGCGLHMDAKATIIHLNDVHLWSREHIAHWVSMVEPQEQLLLEDQREEQPAREYTEVTQ